MKRLTLLLLLLASAAFAQTYVRPSKGVPVPAFSGYDTGFPLSSGATPLIYYGTQYEWTAFDAVRVRVTASGTSSDGGICSGKTLQYTVTDMNSVLRASLQRLGASWTLYMQDSAQASGSTSGGPIVPGASTFITMTTLNASVSLDDFRGCNVFVTLTPAPFAPPAQQAVGALSDGGSSATVSVLNLPEDTIDSNNSVTALTVGSPPLWSSATWQGTARSTTGFTHLLVEASSTKTSAANGFCLNFSSDGSTWRTTHCETLTANVTAVRRFPIEGRYYRLTFTSQDLVASTSVTVQSTLKVGNASQPNAPFQCGSVYQSTYLMDGGIIAMGIAPTRYYSIVCNSRDNSSGVVRCRADGADAGVLSTTAGSIGDVLSVGDCINYSNPTSVPFYCIGSGNWTTLFECSPTTP